MVQIKHELIILSFLMGANATIQSTGEKNTVQQDRETFSKIGPLRKFGVFPSRMPLYWYPSR
jgi:hypothetical protein